MHTGGKPATGWAPVVALGTVVVNLPVGAPVHFVAKGFESVVSSVQNPAPAQ